MADILYDLVPCNGNIPFDKLKYLYNLTLLAMDLTEKQIFDLRYNDIHIQYNYNHECRNNVTLKRVGFISRDFSSNRPSGQLSQHFFSQLKQMLQKYNIEIFFYSPRSKILREFRTYATLRENNNLLGLANMIYQDKIDILIDMQGHMINNFNHILNMKPAPIIIHWLGYPGTLGLKCIDYHIADKIIIPTESIQYYREKIAYLPNCYQVNNPNLIVNKSNKIRKDFNYPEDKFIFCNFNDDYKLNRFTFKIWLEILKRVPNSILLCNMRTDKIKTEIYKDTEEYGIDPSRIIKADWIYSRMPHLNRLALVDCGLDTYYCNGHTTSSDLIAVGKPVITYPGNTYHSRVTKSILLSLDLPELIVNSWDEYIQKAVQISTDIEYYHNITTKLVNNRGKYLYNSVLYTENYINLLLNIWKNHFGTELPEGVPNMTVTKFSHNKRNQNYKWIFYPRKDSPGGDIEKVELKYQKLRDYADDNISCIAFNTSGYIKNSLISISELVDYGESDEDGLWVKEFITST